MQPWKLVADPTGYIFTWLVGLFALLGAVGGVLIADYFVIRRTRLDLAGLYKKDGPYWYAGGFNPLAMIALVLGIAPCVPGFLAAGIEQLEGAATPADLESALYHYAWFISFGVSFVAIRAADDALQPCEMEQQRSTVGADRTQAMPISTDYRCYSPHTVAIAVAA